MVAYDGQCLGRGTPGAFCICTCHIIADAPCDGPHCAPVSASASDHTRLRHINRDPDRGKRASKRGARSLRRA